MQCKDSYRICVGGGEGDMYGRAVVRIVVNFEEFFKVTNTGVLD